jgi:hypothetical protein
MTMSPMSSREGSGVSRRQTLRTQHRSIQARVQAGLPATAAPADRSETIAGSFDSAQFSGGTVHFGGAQVSGSSVDFSRSRLVTSASLRL